MKLIRVREATQGAHVVSGDELELVDLDHFVRELDVYNIALSPVALQLGNQATREA